MKPLLRICLNKILALINFIYRKIFHEEVSSEVEKFIINLSYVGTGVIIASVFSFSYNILAGRLLGPSEYGSFTLVQSVAMFLYIPMLLGFHTALVKYNAEKIDFHRQKSIISTTYILVFLFTIVSILVYMTFSKEIMAIFSISGEIFYYAVMFAVLYVFYTLTTETLRSLHMIGAYSRLKPIFSMILFSSFLVSIYFFNELSFKTPLLSMLSAYGVTGGIVLAVIRKFLIPEFSKEWAHTLHRYSIYSLMGGLSFVIYTNIDKLLINQYLSVVDVGKYTAYHYSFTSITFLVTTIFITVFFPVASQQSTKIGLFKKINKLVYYYIIFAFILAAISGFIIIGLYGPEYPFELTLGLLFVLVAIVISVNQFYGQLMASVGEKGIKVMSLAAISMAIVNSLLNLKFIPVWGIRGAVMATIIAYTISTGIILHKRKYYSDSIVPGLSIK